MKVQDIFIADIIIEDRRREDFGDLHKLAASINKYNLMQPIVVVEHGDKYKLVAGERRIRAYQINGQLEIPARLYSELSDEERDEMELEENDERLNLTPLERSKRLLQRVEKTEERISTAMKEITPTVGRKPQRTVPKKEIAEALSTSEATIVRAEQHVAAVESYPELESAPQAVAISTAKTLDKLPPVKREAARANISTIKPKPFLAKSSKSSPLSGVQDFIYEVKRKGGVLSLTARMTQQEQFSLLSDLQNCIEELKTMDGELTDSLNDIRAEAS